MQVAPPHTEFIRQGWADALNTLAPGCHELSDLLESRLDDAVGGDLVDEPTLLAIAAEAAEVGRTLLDPATADALQRRLQRSVYEFLLSLDAASPEELGGLAPPPLTVVSPSALLIGAEELPPPAASEVVDAGAEFNEEPQEAEAGVAEDAEAADRAAEISAVTAGEPEAAETAAPPAPAVHEPEPGELDEAPGVDGTHPQDATGPEPTASQSRRGRFLVFRRNGTVSAMPGGSTDETSTDLRMAPEPDPAPPETIDQLPEPASPQRVRPAPPPVPLNTFVAPREGFHLVDHADYEDVLPELQQVASSVAEAEAAVEETAEGPAGSSVDEPRERSRGPSSRGWRVRSLRARHRGAALDDDEEPQDDDAVDVEDEDEDETPANLAFNNDPQAIAIRRQVSERLRKRKCDDAAALVQRLAADFGGRPVADLGLDAGDRCRALGKSNAALSCYLAASRADPVYDEPLLRLADICIDDRDIDLAVSYLERVARLHRLRGDLKGALRVYRKIATVAPNRSDILSVLMRAQATGRFDD